jgi:DNA-binding response OmpR family regulator
MIAETRDQLRIVIADDETDAAAMLKRLLEVRGFQIVGVAHDGEAALASILREKPHVGILDLGMPVLDGLAVARQVRKQLQPGPHLLAVTGWGTKQDRIATREAGFDAHLTKPVKWNELEALLVSFLTDFGAADTERAALG